MLEFTHFACTSEVSSGAGAGSGGRFLRVGMAAVEGSWVPGVTATGPLGALSCPCDTGRRLCSCRSRAQDINNLSHALMLKEAVHEHVSGGAAAAAGPAASGAVG